MKKTEKKLLLQMPLKVLLIAFIFLVAVFIFSFIVQQAVFKQGDQFDAKAILFISAHSSPGLVDTMEKISFFGSTTFLLPMYVLLIGWLLVHKKPRRAMDIAIIALSSTAVMFGLKEFFHRQRPSLPAIKAIGGYSFPSGHTMSSFIFCSILIYLVSKANFTTVQKVILILFLLACTLTIGISRVVLNVHYATDVIGGFCLGIIWVILSFWILRRMRKNIEDGTAPAA